MWPAEICSVFINLEAQLLGPKPKPALHCIFSIQIFPTSSASSASLCMQRFSLTERRTIKSSLCLLSVLFQLPLQIITCPTVRDHNKILTDFYNNDYTCSPCQIMWWRHSNDRNVYLHHQPAWSRLVEKIESYKQGYSCELEVIMYRPPIGGF